MVNQRRIIRLISWPDPLLQEKLEDLGFFFDPASKSWIFFCYEAELKDLHNWLKNRSLNYRISEATGIGELKRLPKLSDHLILKNGGSPSHCALCGSQNVPCRQWIEGDDTDSIDYPQPARFYLCGPCVQNQMSPHPRLYAPAEDSL